MLLFLLCPPKFTTLWTLLWDENVYKTKENGVRTRCTVIENHSVAVSSNFLRVASLLRVAFLVRRVLRLGAPSQRTLFTYKTSRRILLQNLHVTSFLEKVLLARGFPWTGKLCFSNHALVMEIWGFQNAFRNSVLKPQSGLNENPIAKALLPSFTEILWKEGLSPGLPYTMKCKVCKKDPSLE